MDILDTRVELGVDEEDFCEHVCMSLNVIESVRATQISFLVLGLRPQLLLKFTLSRIYSISEEVQITACSLYIFLDLNPDLLVDEVATPE